MGESGSDVMMEMPRQTPMKPGRIPPPNPSSRGSRQQIQRARSMYVIGPALSRRRVVDPRLTSGRASGFFRRQRAAAGIECRFKMDGGVQCGAAVVLRTESQALRFAFHQRPDEGSTDRARTSRGVQQQHK